MDWTTKPLQGTMPKVKTEETQALLNMLTKTRTGDTSNYDAWNVKPTFITSLDKLTI